MFALAAVACRKVSANFDSGVIASDAGVPLRVVSEVKVAPETELLKIRDAQGGHPSYSSRLDPVIYDVDNDGCPDLLLDN